MKFERGPFKTSKIKVNLKEPHKKISPIVILCLHIKEFLYHIKYLGFDDLNTRFEAQCSLFTIIIHIYIFVVTFLPKSTTNLPYIPVVENTLENIVYVP